MEGMKPHTIVYIAQSLDGYIADSDGNIDWLEAIPNPNGDMMGYDVLMQDVDAIIMGRGTYETVLAFDIDWPYQIPVYVLSSKLKTVPEHLSSKVFLLNGKLDFILSTLSKKGYQGLYIDGGKTIQSFLAEDLIDELRITTLPILLGGGSSLFGTLENRLAWDHVTTSVYLDQLVQSHYRRKRES